MLKQGEHASGHQSKLVDLELKCVGVLFICTYLHLVRVLFCLTTQKAVERCLILDLFRLMTVPECHILCDCIRLIIIIRISLTYNAAMHIYYSRSSTDIIIVIIIVIIILVKMISVITLIIIGMNYEYAPPQKSNGNKSHIPCHHLCPSEDPAEVGVVLRQWRLDSQNRETIEKWEQEEMSRVSFWMPLVLQSMAKHNGHTWLRQNCNVGDQRHGFGDRFPVGPNEMLWPKSNALGGV